MTNSIVVSDKDEAAKVEALLNKFRNESNE
jgi:hypothetical protein